VRDEITAERLSTCQTTALMAARPQLPPGDLVAVPEPEAEPEQPEVQPIDTA
jgi:hypothetical protein